MGTQPDKSEKRISDAVIRRLPRYYRQLCELEDGGVTRISSKSLGASLSVKASQIRQDLNSFGGFGQQGYGYSVTDLKNHIADILALNSHWKMVIVGAGNIGTALSEYGQFKKEGFEALALFDVDENLVGKTIGKIKIHHVSTLREYIMEHKVDILALAVPSRAVPQLMELAEEVQIGAVWNFTPNDVFSDKFVVENLHLTDSLMALSFRLNKAKQRNDI